MEILYICSDLKLVNLQYVRWPFFVIHWKALVRMLNAADIVRVRPPRTVKLVVRLLF
jgi:hypothetical protein